MDCAGHFELVDRRTNPCCSGSCHIASHHPSLSPSASIFMTLLVSFLLLVALGAVLINGARQPPNPLGAPSSSWETQQQQPNWTGNATVNNSSAVGSGQREGASGSAPSPSWSNKAFQWQHTAFHFQPERNWMNDPNGPLFYKGWYHLFYQYNPYSSVWGNMTWGHAVSRDLIHWLHLPPALFRDHWYDTDGVFTGSATILRDGKPIIIYTGSTDRKLQVQNLAYPADPSDPLLLHWVKSPSNPILRAPSWIKPKEFRDPTTAWYEPADSSWRVAVGAMAENRTGFALVFRTKDFISYDLPPSVLHTLPWTGMWECVDFFPVLVNGSLEGVDGSGMIGSGLKHVLKASMSDHDYYAIGIYDSVTGRWTPDDPAADVGSGLRYDYGNFYASKTFYDSEKRRRVLWGWVLEKDGEAADVAKGWASVQAVPRTVRLDEKTGGANLVQWPVEEVESLRTTKWSFSGVEVGAGQVVPVELHGDADADADADASQLDINVEFEIKKEALMAAALDAKVGFNCSTSGGAAQRGALGPFGLLVLADEDQLEQTAIYIYIQRGVDGELRTFHCQDNLRSSLSKEPVKAVYGTSVPMLDGEKLSLRIILDHSIVESFAQGGRTCITSRAYPTIAIDAAVRLFLFNNATATNVTASSVVVWKMKSAFIKPYPLQ